MRLAIPASAVAGSALEDLSKSGTPQTSPRAPGSSPRVASPRSARAESILGFFPEESDEDDRKEIIVTGGAANVIQACSLSRSNEAKVSGKNLFIKYKLTKKVTKIANLACSSTSRSAIDAIRRLAAKHRSIAADGT